MTKMEFGKDHYLELFQISVMRCVLAGLIWTKPVGHCTFLWSFVVIFAELQLLESQAVTWFLGRCYISRTTIPRIPGSYMVFSHVVLTGWFWNQPVIIESIKIRTIYVEYIWNNICFIKNIIGVFFSLKDRHKTAVVCFENLKASQLEEILFIIPLRRWAQLAALGHHKQMHARETTILETSFISQLGSRCFSPWCAAPWTVTVLTGSGLPLCPVWYKVNGQRFFKGQVSHSEFTVQKHLATIQEKNSTYDASPACMTMESLGRRHCGVAFLQHGQIRGYWNWQMLRKTWPFLSYRTKGELCLCDHNI